MSIKRFATLLSTAAIAAAGMSGGITPITALAAEAPQVLQVIANVESEPYGKAIKSFTYVLNSTEAVQNLTPADFVGKNLVYDANETHKPFDATAYGVSFSTNTINVAVSPFYPLQSFTETGYWMIDCTNDLFDITPDMEITYSDPVIASFTESEAQYNTARSDYYLYTPEDTSGPQPIVIFNSGGTGISTTGDLYGANFAVSFAKEDAQELMNAYVLYPQRNEGETADMCALIKGIVDDLVAQGKVDADRIYMTGESAGSLFTWNFVKQYPGYCAAIVTFDGGGTVNGTTLEETMQEDMDSPFSDADMAVMAASGTKVMLVQSVGDTTSTPIKYATTYSKLVALGMVPGKDIIWRPYSAENFNGLLGDNTEWEYLLDGNIVTDPISGLQTYDYKEGKLHNGSYPGANDNGIKLWLMNQHKGAYTPEQTNDYSAKTINDTKDYSIIPEMYTQVATLEDAPGVPAGSKTTLTVYTTDDYGYYYVGFMTFFEDKMQYVEGIVVGNEAHVIMDCSGSWWTADANSTILPYIMEQQAAGAINWQPYTR